MADGVWQSAAFIGLFGDPYLRNTPYEAGGSPQALAATLDVLAQVLHPQSAFVQPLSSSSTSASDDPVAFVLSGAQEQFVLDRLVPQLERCKQWTEAALKVGDATQLQAFLVAWKAQLLQLQLGEPLLVPGGFVSNVSSHTIMYVVEKGDADQYTFTVCNKGPGADLYHPQAVQPHTSDKVRVQSCVQISAIPASRFLDMAFWTLLFSLWVRTPPSEYHRAETLYDVLLPWLAGDKLLPLAFEDAETATGASASLGTVHTPQRSNVGFCKSPLEAIRYLCLRSGAFTAAEVQYAVLFKLRYRLFQRTVRDLEVVNNPSRAFPADVLDRALQTLSTVPLTDSLQGSHTLASIAPDAVVGIYFARSTDTASRKFTKTLTALTASLQAANRSLVVIVVSVDQEQTDYTALTADLPALHWLVVPFSEVEARKQLIQTFQVTAVPTLVLRSVNGAILTAKGRELVQADPTGRFFPWTGRGFKLPKAALSLSATKCIEMATKQIGLKTLAHNSHGNVTKRGLSHVNALMAHVDALMKEIRDANVDDAEPRNAKFQADVAFVGHANAGLLQLGRREDEYAGNAAELHAPTLGNFLDVPERVTSLPLAVAAFVRCRALCESLLTRAAEGSSSSRISLHHEVIQLLTSLLVEVLPVPDPSPAAGTASTCMWRQPVTREMQLRCLTFLYSALMTLGSVWQSMEQPSRHFDSERSLAALCALSMCDALLRTPASDEPLEMSLLMEQEGGYVLAHRFCKANLSLTKMTALMEFARPSFCLARGRVLAYFDRQDAVSKYQLFQYHMPEDKVELKKYSTTLIFFRQLMEKYGYQLIDPENPTPPTEMEALMEWFCSEDTPMAREHPEVALARDLVLVVKFLATMETKEIELMRRRVAHQHWQMWQLSFDDSSSSHRRNFFGMRGLNRILNASLTWEVTNFRGSDQDIADVDVVGFMERKIFFGEGPVMSSPAELSALIMSAAKGAATAPSLPSPITEDDIMHLSDLPTFHGTLSAEESEYLLCYLTVPYARIPLVAAFFASRDRVTYLFNPMLQQLFRAVLFESGDWVSDAHQADVTHVPLRKSTLLLHEESIQRVFDARVTHQKCEDHLGTMNGLLLNELLHAPDAVVAPLLKMLEAIKELGEASVHSADAKFILFMLKLAVDVLLYVTFAIDESLANDASGKRAKLEAYRQSLLAYAFGFGHSTLHKWREEAEAANNLQTACVIHSYLVLLHMSLRASEYTYERVSSMLGSIAYVRNWHCFGMKLSVETGEDKSGLSAEERLLRWLQAQGIKTENVSKTSLEKYLKGRPLYLKIGMQTIQAPSIVALRDGDGNELKLPPGEVLEEEIFETIQIHRRGVVKWLNSLVSRARHEVLGSIVRIALRSSEPDEEHEWSEDADVAGTGRYVCKKTELKLDAQTGEILWRNDELKPVPDSMTQYADFKAIFGNKSLHCGLVARQEHRLWVNIIGTDFELVEWDDPTDSLDQGVGAPTLYERGSETQDGDASTPGELKMYWECPACTCANFNGDNPNAVCDVCATPRFVRASAPPEPSPTRASDVDGYSYLGKQYSRAFDPYSEDEHPHPDEQWLVDLVGGVLRLQYPPDPEDKKLPFTFFLPSEPLAAGATRVQLIGHDLGPKEKKEKDKEKMATFKEIVAYRYHQVVHIYSLVTHGRRLYRKLIFTSNSRLSLHGFALTISPDDGPKDPLLLRAAGDPRERQTNGGTLVVLRRNVALNGTEQFVPPRLLQGVVPSCLLEAFRFWLGTDHKLRGEPVDVKSQWFRYRVEVEIVDDASAIIKRKSIKTSFSRISTRRDGSGFTNGNKLMPPPAPVAAPTSRGAAKPPSRGDVVVVNDEDVVQLMAMGFSYAACGLSLRENHNNVAMAAQWLLDDANQLKIGQAEAAAEAGDVPMSEEDVHEQKLGLLMSFETSPSRVAAEYVLDIFGQELEVARAWLADPTNADEIQRVEAASSERKAATTDNGPVPMDVGDEEAKSEDVDEVMEVVEEAFGETLYLLNVLEATATTGGDLLELSALLARVEDHSHILIWSTKSGDSDSSIGLASIAFIELPRLKLKLKPRRESSAVIRLDVLDQNGWSVSDLTFGARGGGSKYLQSIIDLTPDCLVLESDTNDLKLVCPNHDVYRPSVQGEPFSTLFVTDRASLGWQQAMETRFYSYPIHSSHTFVLPPSLSSTLYLILTSLLARKYTAAMELIIGCNVDVKFTDEEKWIFDQFEKTLDDRHPNACACRIRLSLGVAYSDNKVPWKLKPELHDYLSTTAHVDAVCRLTFEEEKEALANCHQRSPLLSLRKVVCDHASETHPASFEFKLSRSRVGGQPWMKLRMFGKEYMAAHGKKLSTVRYNRPKHAAGIDTTFLIDDEEAAKLVWNCAVIGDEVSGSNRGLGFLFLYECLNSQLVVRLGDEDCTRSFGDLFARFLHLKLSRWGRETVDEGEEESVPSYPMAQLALLAAHPHDRWSLSPCDHESTQMLSRGANLYSKMTYGTMLKLFFDSSVEEFESRLQAPAHQDGVVAPIKGQFGRVHASADQVVQVHLEPMRQAIEFSASNTSCEQRPFSAATHVAINPEFPLDSLDVKKFVTFCDPDAKAAPALPFDLSQHPAAQTAAAKDLLKRLDDDIRINAKSVNESKDAFVAGVTPVEASTLASGTAANRLHDLVRACEELRKRDRSTVATEILALEQLVNATATAANEQEQVAIDRFVMQRRVGVFPRVTFDFLTSLLASTAFETDLRTRNPFIQRLPADLTERILAVLFLCNRIVHINRTIQSARALLAQLTAATSDAPAEAPNRLKQTLQASKDLADMLLSKRHYLKPQSSVSSSSWTFDPRFLVFEYVFDLLLRGRQVQMIDSFVASLARGDSRVQQMIMGAGKTTVVGPLLTYILADKQHLVTHVMPTALLEQSRQVLRSRFSNLVLRKRIFTFEFDRSVSDDPTNAINLVKKLNRARAHGDVVCASPESVKSLMLKLVELLHSLEESTDVLELPVHASSQNVRRLRRVLEDRSEMADELYKVIRLWQDGILIMDEVDVLLHPLRSELNFPIGNKFPIDLAANRWELPIHLIDAVLAAPSTRSQDEPVTPTTALVTQLHEVLADGYRTHSLQKFPHLVLLDMEFYEARMLPLLTEIALEWLLKHFRMGKMDVDFATLTRYLTCSRADLQSNADLRDTVERGLSDLSIKLLNLGRDWLRTILPHVLSKINRVSYGLLRGEHASSSAGNAPSRLLLAVPFIGKDVPSRSSEFAHPDVLIGLTILAYRYEGIRVSDLVRIVSQLKQDFSRQLGPRDQRPASAMFREWVTSGLAASIADGRTDESSGAGVLPLPLFQLRDPAQVARLHFLVTRLADAVYYYVRQHVFPACMTFQKLKLSACGHELGSDTLFAKRIGFSGTPSNLLPMDLGECFYEPRSDGSIFQALTNPRIVSLERKVNWSATSLLLDIATAKPGYHALIDTGALITGFANQEVAAFLLAHLPPSMEGVVYLDSDDRQMILLRDHNAPMPLVQCGLHPSKRFTFYDQVHTTGMDIKQCVNACAVVTLGKDMTFRDYAQGAYRMRGIETGQSIHLFLIPEVENRIRHEVALSQSTELVAQSTSDLQAYLLLVPAWLLVNSMRMESMQLVQLSLQELHNTWRKRALNALMDEIDSATTPATQAAPSLFSRMRRFIGPDDAKRWLRACVDKFRVEISYAVEAAVPMKKDLADVIAALVHANASFVTTAPELARIEDVKQRLAHSSSHHVAADDDGSEQGDLRLTTEVVHENEAEAEEEAEEEAEQEEQKMSAYTRDDEHPIPWSASVLAQSPLSTTGATVTDEDGAFYPFAQFQAHTECPAIAFPAQLLVSGNFFRRRWVGLGERRVKNVGLVLEWTPLGQQEALRTVMHHLFRSVVAASPGLAPNEAAVQALALAAAVPTTAVTDVPLALQRDVQQAVGALPVFLVALSLAEGETIRRMIHQNHPVFQTSHVQLRTCEGELVESSSFAATWGPPPEPSSRALEVATGIQCLRFFNNEMYFAPAELELLLAGLAPVPLALRHEFFENCLRFRRRERHLWGDTPLAKVFTKQDEWHLLSARARLQQFQQSLQRKKRTLHVPSALQRFDENRDGRLSAEEMLKCFESFQLGYSGAELHEIISLIADVGALEATGGVSMATICAAFGISELQMREVLARDALLQQQQAAAGDDALLATWSCPVCTFANDGGADSCGACSEPNPLVQQSKDKAGGGTGPLPGWRCSNCTFINQPNDAACAVCELGMDGQRAVPRGKWICAGEQGGCTFFNPTASFYCEVCNRARPDLAATRF